MRRNSGSDHLAHSFTDLMTSLMVIFILLLLVFVNNQASVNTVTAQDLMNELRKSLVPAGFKQQDIRIDPHDPATILLAVSDAQLNFQPNSFGLQPEGTRFVESRMPTLTSALCSPKYRDAIESVIVEGHSDSTPWRGLTAEESQARNLKLSQQRSMEVVEQSLVALTDRPTLRTCLLEKISATGRGEQDLAKTADESRRAVIKVRVNATHAVQLAKAIGAVAPATPAPPVLTPAASKVLDALSRLSVVPPQPVQAHLTDDEVNQYIEYSLLRTPRSGLRSISLKFFPHDYISAQIVIDFDAVQQWMPGIIPDFLNLKGQKALWIDFRFHVNEKSRTLTYSIEKSFYDGRALPHFLAEQIVKAIGARQPENAGGDEIAIPFGLKTIRTGDHFVDAAN